MASTPVQDEVDDDVLTQNSEDAPNDDDGAQNTQNLQDCVLGHDLGNLYSKMALAYSKDGNVHLHRVLFTGDDDDENYPDDNTEFEFVASAALVRSADGQVLVEGVPALKHDLNIPLKTMLVYVALGEDHVEHRKEVVEGLPSGPALLKAVDDEEITPALMDDILQLHFTRLRRMAEAQAARVRAVIRVLAITYPNYLFYREATKDFDKFIDHYMYLLRLVWGPRMRFRLMSEGQAVAMYICSPFFDTISGDMQEQIERLFRGLDKRSWVNLTIIDSGSSSLNIQSVCVWFDEHGKLDRSQSFVRPGQLAGVQGGSQLANDEVRRIVKKSVRAAEEAGVQFPEGSIANYVRCFEKLKRDRSFNYQEYITERKNINLHAQGAPQLRIDLNPRQIKKVFGAAFDRGLAALEQEMNTIMESGKDMGILFTGGSYQSKGLRAQAEQKVESFRRQFQRERRGTKINVEFLGKTEMRWTTAVSGGAAIGVLTVPRLASLLEQFTIGIQRVRWRHDSERNKNRWLGDSTATVLGTAGSNVSRAREWSIPHRARRDRVVRFELVADPMYHNSDDWGDLPDIHIDCRLRNRANDRHIPPYEIGCQITAADIPLGSVRFALGGRRWQMLLDGEIDTAIDNESVPIILKCFKVNQRGEPVRHAQDKKFLLRIVPDPASRLPIVSQEEDFQKNILPFWCSACAVDIEGGMAKMCRTENCDFNLCSICSDGDYVHPVEHRLSQVDVDF